LKVGIENVILLIINDEELELSITWLIILFTNS